MLRCFRLVLAGVVAFLCVGVAVAQGVENACHDIDADVARLSCYDKQTGFAGGNQVPVSVDDPDLTGNQWTVTQEVSNLDNRKDVWLSVVSDETQPNQIGRPEKARLWVRCMKNRTNVFITFNDYTPNNQNVQYKIDVGPVRKIWMVHMQGGKGVGLWSGKTAIPFSKNLFGKQRLIVGYKSYSNNNLEFTFDIAGLRSRIKPLASSCQWRL